MDGVQTISKLFSVNRPELGAVLGTHQHPLGPGRVQSPGMATVSSRSSWIPLPAHAMTRMSTQSVDRVGLGDDCNCLCVKSHPFFQVFAQDVFVN